MLFGKIFLLLYSLLLLLLLFSLFLLVGTLQSTAPLLSVSLRSVEVPCSSVSPTVQFCKVNLFSLVSEPDSVVVWTHTHTHTQDRVCVSWVWQCVMYKDSDLQSFHYVFIKSCLISVTDDWWCHLCVATGVVQLYLKFMVQVHPQSPSPFRSQHKNRLSCGCRPCLFWYRNRTVVVLSEFVGSRTSRTLWFLSSGSVSFLVDLLSHELYAPSWLSGLKHLQNNLHVGLFLEVSAGLQLCPKLK